MDDSFTINEDQTGATSVLTNDTGSSISISSIVTFPANGNLYLSGTTGSTLVTTGTTDFSIGNLVYLGNSNYCGTNTFRYTMTDTGLLLSRSDTATGTVTVTCINDAPVANNDTQTSTGTEDTNLVIPVTANDTDVDNTITSITGLTQPSTGGVVSITGGTSVLFVPTLDFCTSTPLTFTYQAQDGSGGLSSIAT